MFLLNFLMIRLRLIHFETSLTITPSSHTFMVARPFLFLFLSQCLLKKRHTDNPDMLSTAEAEPFKSLRE